jgi:hypothetical protein
MMAYNPKKTDLLDLKPVVEGGELLFDCSERELWHRPSPLILEDYDWRAALVEDESDAADSS